MGLEKAIAHGKEHRKPYYDSRAVSGECRNHGGCPWCTGNRLHGFEKQKQAAIQKLKEYYSNDGQNFSNDEMPVIFYCLNNKIVLKNAV